MNAGLDATRAPSVPPPSRLSPADAAIWETYVVPRLLSHFGELALETLLEIEDAQAVHLGCRTGFPDRGMALKLQNSAIVGVDTSPSALALARAKAITMTGMLAEYRLVDGGNLPLPDAAFSHALCIYPISESPASDSTSAREPARTALIREARRLLAPSGQCVLALPLEGSYAELLDLFREFALKVDDASFGAAVERTHESYPSAQALSSEFERAGFEYVDVASKRIRLPFASARELLEDPAFRLAILPDLRAALGVADLDRALSYAREAIDRYWSDGSFALTLHAGCVSSRRPAAR